MMSERTPKQPLNDPEYTVPEYSVLLPSSELKYTAGGDAAFNNVTSDSAADNSAAEGNAPGGSAPRARQHPPSKPLPATPRLSPPSR